MQPRNLLLSLSFTCLSFNVLFSPINQFIQRSIPSVYYSDLFKSIVFIEIALWAAISQLPKFIFVDFYDNFIFFNMQTEERESSDEKLEREINIWSNHDLSAGHGTIFKFIFSVKWALNEISSIFVFISIKLFLSPCMDDSIHWKHSIVPAFTRNHINSLHSLRRFSRFCQDELNCL